MKLKQIDLSKLNNVIEVGHFYMNQDVYNLGYLNNVYLLELCKDEKYTPIVFIDDIHIAHSILNLGNLKRDIESIIGRDILFVYESQMDAYIDILYSTIVIKTKVYKGGSEVKQQILHNDKLYTVATVKPIYKLSCLGYSIIWSLLRTKMNRQKTITILDSKFKSIEDIVKDKVDKVEVFYY